MVFLNGEYCEDYKARMEIRCDNADVPLNDHSFNNNEEMSSSGLLRKVKTFQERMLIVKIFVCLIVLTLILICVIFITLYLNVLATLPAKTESEYCMGHECVQIAARIIESMDLKVDPCKNFYEYACGKWVRDTEIPASRSRYSRFEQLSEHNSIVLKQILHKLLTKNSSLQTPVLMNATTYYKSCLDVKQIEKIGTEPLTRYMEALGSWPVTDPHFDIRKWDFMRTMVLLHRDVARSPIFKIFVASDIKQSDVNVLVFDQSELGMDDKESYLKNDTFYINKREAYRKLMKDTVTELGANETGIGYMDEVFKFESELATFTASVEERRRFRLIYETMTLEEFANRTNIPIAWLVEFLEKTVLLGKSSISPKERIVSYATNYIKKAYRIFKSLPSEVQVSYLLWHGVRLMAPVVMGRFQDIMDDYLSSVHGITSREPRWETCVANTMSLFGYVLSRPFVEQVYDKAAKAMSTEMIQAIKGVFASNLETMDWMDATTKEYAVKKVAHIVDNIGYPDMIYDNTALEKDQGGLQVLAGEYFRNFMAREKHNRMKNYKLYGKPVDKSKWSVLPTDVNAYYAPTENKIGFPAGILQWPFYDRRSPRAISYGAIGMVVGHEVSHAFDDQGKDFTIEGNFETWWTEHSLKAFKKKSQCFIDQYNNFTLFGKHINGRQTLGENLADNGGLRQSMQAYRLWVAKNGPEKKLPGLDLSPEQLYFLAFGQVWCTRYRESAAILQMQNGVHSLSMFRVIGTLQNSDDFSTAFNCPIGSPMNPSKKCRIW